ncbi:MAG: protein-glutamate O-methyltransferase CheR, partial [Myxococcota bacterium]
MMSDAQTVARACTLIEQWIGITLRGAAPHRLREFLERRAQALGYPSAEGYLREIERLSISDPEPRQLVNLVTNGLTTFWRDPPQLDALRVALLGLSKRYKRQLTIWCAGCSTGEEAYTVSMICKESGIDAAILGSDINTEFLNHAQSAIYSPWSLRRLDEARQRRWFDTREGGLFSIRQELLENLYFRQHNLLATPPLSPSGEGWDVVMCRNVLIYFREDALYEVLNHFAGAMAPHGYLMFGSSEQLTARLSRRFGPLPFRATRHGEGFVYRLSTTPPGSTAFNLLALPRREELEEFESHTHTHTTSTRRIRRRKKDETPAANKTTWWVAVAFWAW